MVLDEATIPPAHLLAMIDRLPEGSMTVAMRAGGDDWRDYFEADLHYHVAAGIFDAINSNTLGTGNWKKGHEPKFKPWPTPAVLTKRRKSKPKSVRDLFNKARAALPGA